MFLKKIKAIVFDVAGTLYRQGSLRRRILLELAVESFRRPASGLRTIQALRAYRRAQEIARHRCETLTASDMQLEIACKLSSEDPDFVRQAVWEWFQRRPLRHLKSRAHPGLLSFLGAARSSGIRLG